MLLQPLPMLQLLQLLLLLLLLLLAEVCEFIKRGGERSGARLGVRCIVADIPC